ncbi:MAG: AAA family ATPase [Nitrospirae bacterium]|nr:AAA family ATPase [Nitrospirota bacterium]
MYEQFYNFTEKPFNLTPDSKYFFSSKEHEEALNSLIYTVNERKGFAVITGEIGSGKTTICRTFLNKLDTHTKTAIITNTYLTGKQLIQLALEDFGIQTKSKNKVQLMKELNNFLIRQLSLGYNVVLIVDEAQNLRPSVLEEIRMLSNLETEKEKLIQILLLGQPELRDQLNLQKLAQLKQRINVYYHIYPLNEEETTAYINHRLKIATKAKKPALPRSVKFNCKKCGKLLVASLKHADREADCPKCKQAIIIPSRQQETTSPPPVHFTTAALQTIYAYSHGIPRLINMVCDQSLLTSYVQGSHKITETLVKDALAEFSGKH